MEREGRGTLHISQAYPKRPKQLMEMKGQGAEIKEKKGASVQPYGGPGHRAWDQGQVRGGGGNLGRQP